MVSGKSFHSVEDARAWLNREDHGIKTATVQLNVGGRWRTFKNFGDGLLYKNDWAEID